MDATATTTPNDEAQPAPGAAPAKREDRSSRSLTAAAAGLVLGGALLALGVPRLVAAVAGLDARDVLWDARAGADLPAERLAEGAASLARAERWIADGESAGDRGYLLLRQARATPAGPARDALLAQAAAATAAGLGAAPAQPSAWARLAHLRAVGGDRRGAAEALRLSILSGPVAPALMESRLELGLELLRDLDPDTVRLLRRQVRLTWIVAPDAVAGLAQRPAAGPFVREALADLTEEELQNFLKVHGTGR